MAKARNLRQRGRKWVVYFRVEGRQHWKSFDTREDASLYLAKSRTEKLRGEFRPPAKIRFREFAAEWLRDYAQGNVRPSTFAGYETVLRNHLVPEFGELHLNEITRKAITAFVADWRAGGPRYRERVRLARELEATRAKVEGRPPRSVRLGNSPKTISNAIVPLREMLGHAVEWGYLSTNPAAGIKRPQLEHAEMHFLDADEVRRLLEAARPEWRTFLLCAVTTGMRIGELLAVRWGDVDWQRRRIWVRRSVDRGGRFSQPKTAKSTRAIAMPPTLVSALREHLMASRFKGEDDLIFATRKGTPLVSNNVVRREFKPTLRRARLPQIRFHDLRHTFASLLVAQGEHPKLIAEQLGHASAQITIDRYSHLMDQSYGDASDRLEQALFGEGARAGAAVPK